MTALQAIIGRDLALGFRAGGGALQTATFFALAILIFALAIGPDVQQLQRVAAPALWAAALLSTLLSFDRLFQTDFEDGSLDVMVATSDSLEATVLAKAAAHWLSACLPIILVAPVLGLLFNLPTAAHVPLLASLVVGTPALSLIGSVAAAVTLALRRASILIAILAAPLFAPVLIFGVGAAAGEAGAEPALMLLAATSLFSLVVAPLAAAAAIRFNMS
jgi:heme exporter protein B